MLTFCVELGLKCCSPVHLGQSGPTSFAPQLIQMFDPLLRWLSKSVQVPKSLFGVGAATRAYHNDSFHGEATNLGFEPFFKQRKTPSTISGALGSPAAAA